MSDQLLWLDSHDRHCDSTVGPDFVTPLHPRPCDFLYCPHKPHSKQEYIWSWGSGHLCTLQIATLFYNVHLSKVSLNKFCSVCRIRAGKCCRAWSSSPLSCTYSSNLFYQWCSNLLLELLMLHQNLPVSALKSRKETHDLHTLHMLYTSSERKHSVALSEFTGTWMKKNKRSSYRAVLQAKRTMCIRLRETMENPAWPGISTS